MGLFDKKKKKKPASDVKEKGSGKDSGKPSNVSAASGNSGNSGTKPATSGSGGVKRPVSALQRVRDVGHTPPARRGGVTRKIPKVDPGIDDQFSESDRQGAKQLNQPAGVRLVSQLPAHPPGPAPNRDEKLKKNWSTSKEDKDAKNAKRSLMQQLPEAKTPRLTVEGNGKKEKELRLQPTPPSAETLAPTANGSAMKNVKSTMATTNTASTQSILNDAPINASDEKKVEKKLPRDKEKKRHKTTGPHTDTEVSLKEDTRRLNRRKKWEPFLSSQEVVQALEASLSPEEHRSVQEIIKNGHPYTAQQKGIALSAVTVIMDAIKNDLPKQTRDDPSQMERIRRRIYQEVFIHKDIVPEIWKGRENADTVTAIPEATTPDAHGSASPKEEEKRESREKEGRDGVKVAKREREKKRGHKEKEGGTTESTDGGDEPELRETKRRKARNKDKKTSAEKRARKESKHRTKHRDTRRRSDQSKSNSVRTARPEMPGATTQRSSERAIPMHDRVRAVVSTISTAIRSLFLTIISFFKLLYAQLPSPSDVLEGLWMIACWLYRGIAYILSFIWPWLWVQSKPIPIDNPMDGIAGSPPRRRREHPLPVIVRHIHTADDCVVFPGRSSYDDTVERCGATARAEAPPPQRIEWRGTMFAFPSDPKKCPDYKLHKYN